MKSFHLLLQQELGVQKDPQVTNLSFFVNVQPHPHLWDPCIVSSRFLWITKTSFVQGFHLGCFHPIQILTISRHHFMATIATLAQ